MAEGLGGLNIFGDGSLGVLESLFLGVGAGTDGADGLLSLLLGLGNGVGRALARFTLNLDG